MDVSTWDSVITSHQGIVTKKLQQLVDNTSRNQLEDSFYTLQKTNLEIIQELVEVMLEVRNHQYNTRVVKTTGTSIGALGAVSMVAGVCLAPFTAGASSLLSIGGFVAAGKSYSALLLRSINNGFQSQYFLCKQPRVVSPQYQPRYSVEQRAKPLLSTLKRCKRDRTRHRLN